jgi:lipid-A-disaccharide synthase
MSAAGLDLIYDMGQLSVVGVTDVIRNIFELRRLGKQLLAEAIKRKPDVVIGVDYGGFNLRFGHMVKQYLRDNPFTEWKPKVVQFISPQVWASRPKRADRMAGDYDLLLSIFPFEKEWYAKRVPALRVEFVGHPMVERFAKVEVRSAKAKLPLIILLPGSRKSEIKRHWLIMLTAAAEIGYRGRFLAIFPNQELLDYAQSISKWEIFTIAETLHDANSSFDLQVGGLSEALAQADLAIAKTGTVTMECAFFRVPTVTLYKGSWLNYQIARRVVTIKSFTMPNILAGEEVFPEFLQYDLTAENLARATLELLQDENRRAKMHAQLDKIIASLGEPGATKRAADSIVSLLA